MQKMSYDKRRKVKKSKTVSQLKKELDKIFSQYVRIKGADRNTQIGVCVTCGVKKPWKELQAGHYEKRGKNQLRYDETNVHPQCVGCNVFQKGNYTRYARYMIDMYGADYLKELEEEAKKIKQWKVYELEDLLTEYKAKLKALDTDK